jgi:hypothetical protein
MDNVTKFTAEFMAQQRELAEKVDALRKLDEDAVKGYFDCGGLVKIYPRFSHYNARIINTFKSNAANNFIPALDEIERLQAIADRFASFGERIVAWLVKGNLEPSWYDDFMDAVEEYEAQKRQEAKQQAAQL